MTFDPTVPQNSDSPGIFPAQNQANMSRLQTLLGADHQFNLTAAADDGYHNLVHLTQQAPTGALAATGRLYVKSSAGQINLFYMDDAGVEFQITPTAPIRAFVNFDGRTIDGSGNALIRSAYNVATVHRDAEGVFKVTFSTAMPNANYIVQITGMGNSSGSDTMLGCVQYNATYSNSVQTGFVITNFFRADSASLKDPLMGSVTIMSVS